MINFKGILVVFPIYSKIPLLKGGWIYFLFDTILMEVDYFVFFLSRFFPINASLSI